MGHKIEGNFSDWLEGKWRGWRGSRELFDNFWIRESGVGEG